jgi:hypothetical protein
MSSANNSDFVTGSALPFKTQDAILANCLRAAGFAETTLSPLNLYDADILFKAGGGQKDKDGKVTRPSRYAGKNIVEAARQAHKEGQRGRIEYHFEHHPDIAKFCKIYAEQTKEIESGEDRKDAAARLLEIISENGTPNPSVPSVVESFRDPRERLFRILCIALKLRIEFVNRWKKQTPYLLVKETAASSSTKLPDGGKLVTLPGGKLVPISAPDQTFKNLGLI